MNKYVLFSSYVTYIVEVNSINLQRKLDTTTIFRDIDCGLFFYLVKHVIAEPLVIGKRCLRKASK